MTKETAKRLISYNNKLKRHQKHYAIKQINSLEGDNVQEDIFWAILEDASVLDKALYLSNDHIETLLYDVTTWFAYNTEEMKIKPMGERIKVDEDTRFIFLDIY